MFNPSVLQICLDTSFRKMYHIKWVASLILLTYYDIPEIKMNTYVTLSANMCITKLPCKIENWFYLVFLYALYSGLKLDKNKSNKSVLCHGIACGPPSANPLVGFLPEFWLSSPFQTQKEFKFFSYWIISHLTFCLISSWHLLINLWLIS